MTPQSVDTKTLAQLGDKWRDASPYPAVETAFKKLRGNGELLALFQ